MGEVDVDEGAESESFEGRPRVGNEDEDEMLDTLESEPKFNSDEAASNSSSSHRSRTAL